MVEEALSFMESHVDGIEVNRLIKFFVYYVICIGMSYASIHA